MIRRSGVDDVSTVHRSGCMIPYTRPVLSTCRPYCISTIRISPVVTNCRISHLQEGFEVNLLFALSLFPYLKNKYGKGAIVNVRQASKVVAQ